VASAHNRMVTHHLTLGADLVLFGSILRQLFRDAPKQDGEFVRKWAPVSCVFCGVVLLLFDPLRHVLLDHGAQEQSLAMYTQTGDLSAAGRTCQLATIVGICMLVGGMLWFTRLCEKVWAAMERSRYGGA